MNVQTSVVKISARRQRPSRWLHFALDFVVLCLLFTIASNIAWGSLQPWGNIERFLPAVTIIFTLTFIKPVIVRNQAHRVEQLAKMASWVFLLYSGLSIYLVLFRSEYSRAFLVSSFLLVMAWQIIDFLFIPSKASTTNLAAVPSYMIDKLRVLSGYKVNVLGNPTLEHKVEGVVVDLHDTLDADWHRFIAECAASGVPIYHAAAVYEAASERVPLSHINEGWVTEFFGGQSRYLPIKRILDVGVVLVALPLLIPVTTIIALLVKLDSPGPAIYRQQRVGERGETFTMFKFRSMKIDSEKNGAQFATSKDPRVTRIGRVLRRYRLDELPQLWNVLKGQMSIIGPRPEQVNFASEFEREIPLYKLRHRVKPGITGWAQVQYGYTAGLDATKTKIEYDLYYIKHLSFWLDLSIVIRTLKTVLTGSGAR